MALHGCRITCCGGRQLNRFKVKASSVQEIIEYVAILMIVLSSGSMYFTIMNVQNTLFALLIIAVVTAAVCKIDIKSFKRNALFFAGIIGCLLLNMAFNLQFVVIDNDIFILLIRLTSLLLIQSSITGDSFIRKYVKILYVLSIISLVSFLYMTVIDYRLPFIVECNRNDINYFYTFYHTVGYRTVYQRNAGIFWEAPAFAVFITMALMFVITRPDLFFKAKKSLKYYAIFIITLATTLSVYGFVYIGVIGVLMLVSSKNVYITTKKEGSEKKNKKRRRYYIIGFIVMLLVLIVVENRWHLISHKLINKKGSYGTRFNDTYYSLVLASRRLLVGYGIFNNYTVNALRQFGIENNSNGLAILFMAIGLPMLLLAIWRIIISLKKLLHLNGLNFIVVGALFFLFHFSEHLWLYTLFVSFLFGWQSTKNNKSRELQG